jgi:uncharacterized protein YkwD
MRRNPAFRALIAAPLAVGLACALAATAIATPAQAPGSDTKPEAADACPDASIAVADATVTDLRKSLRCLIGVERTARGLTKLKANEPLATAAQRHVKTMVATACLDHRCPGEVNLNTRLRRAGYFDDATSWRYAESTGCGITAESMFTSWMSSDYHRANILDPEFEDIGVAASQESVPELCEEGLGTFAVVFGTRNP